MTGYDFCCWFGGVLDMNPDGLSAENLAVVREKLKQVKSPAQFAKEAEANGKPDFVARC